MTLGANNGSGLERLLGQWSARLWLGIELLDPILANPLANSPLEGQPQREQRLSQHLSEVYTDSGAWTVVENFAFPGGIYSGHKIQHSIENYEFSNDPSFEVLQSAGNCGLI